MCGKADKQTTSNAKDNHRITSTNEYSHMTYLLTHLVAKSKEMNK